jgi:hypothetical protein
MPAPKRSHPHASQDKLPSTPRASVSATPSGASLFQQVAHAPGSLSASDVLQLQKTIGNQAVVRLLQQHPPIQRVRTRTATATRASGRIRTQPQRLTSDDLHAKNLKPQTESPKKKTRKSLTKLKTKTDSVRKKVVLNEPYIKKMGKGVTLQIDQTTGIIKSLSLKGTSRSHTALRSGQGDHITPVVVAHHTIRNHLLGKTFRGALTEIDRLIAAVRALPGLVDKKSNDVAHQHLDHAEGYSKQARLEGKATGIPLLKAAIGEVLAGRNSAKYTTIKNTTSTGGHDEAGNAGALMFADDKLRKGETLPSTKGLIKRAWLLLDFVPIPSTPDEAIAKALEQHIRSIVLAYPNLFAGTLTKLQLFNYFKNTHHAVVFKKIRDKHTSDTTKRINTIISDVKNRAGA